MSRHALYLTVVRSLLHIVGLGAMFTALRFLPLADAVAMAFVMPFIMLLLGWLVLSEEVGRHRFLACTVGFAGTMLVVQPSFAAVGAPALLPLLVAFVFALFMLVSRKLATGERPHRHAGDQRPGLDADPGARWPLLVGACRDPLLRDHDARCKRMDC